MRKIQRHPRFNFYCDGFLIKSPGERVRFLVDDISESGLKVQLEGEAALGRDYQLLVRFGILRSAEVKAKAVWLKNGVLGLEIKTPDQAWKDLVAQVSAGKTFVF